MSRLGHFQEHQMCRDFGASDTSQSRQNCPIRELRRWAWSTVAVGEKLIFPAVYFQLHHQTVQDLMGIKKFSYFSL